MTHTFAPPHATRLQSWCAGHTHTWATKCAWNNDNCVACDECSHAPPPAAPAPTCDIYVGPAGDDANEGCDASAPKLTIGACIAAVAERGAGGGTCLLFPGTYREASDAAGQLVVDVTGLTIALAPSEVWPEGGDDAVVEATIDGTIDLDGWQEMSDAHGTYYRSTAAYDGTVWQVFADGVPLTPARWPNALLWTEAWWTREEGWASLANGSACGHAVDAGTRQGLNQTLESTGVSFDGCNAIVNNEHWISRRYKVRGHVAGTSVFDYDVDPTNELCQKYGEGDYHSDAAYFIDGCVAAFDVAGEWVSDADGHLLLRLPEGVSDISSLTLTGKVQTYAFAFDGCAGVTLRGLSFFATTVLLYDIENATIADCSFRYASASRRALGGDAAEFDAAAAYGIASSSAAQGLVADMDEYEIVVPSTWVGRRAWTDMKTRLLFESNTAMYSEGPALVCAYCSADVVHNNHIEMAGYPWARALQFGGTDTHYVTVSRNRIDYAASGAIAWMWGVGNVAEYNRISHSGMLIVDNEGIQGGKPTSHASFRFNWVHDSRGLGLRFDAGEDGLFGDGNQLAHNVAMRNLQGGISQKSNNASTYRNTAVDNQGGEDIEAEGTNSGMTSGAADLKVCRCYPSNCEGERNGEVVHAFTNFGSVTRGNVGIMDPGTIGGLHNPYDIPGEHSHNLNLATTVVGTTPERTLAALFRDYKNDDFRPRANSALVDAGAEVACTYECEVPGAPATVGAAPDIGAYEYGSTVYWIPGPQYTYASSPVPPTNASGVMPDADLMFQPARGAASHRVYLAEVEEGVEPPTLQMVGELSGESNIFTPASRLLPGSSYTWRVDAVGSDGAVTTGEEWTIHSVGCMDVDCVDCGTSTEAASCLACADGYDLASGRCTGTGGCLEGYWTVDLVALEYAVGSWDCAGEWECTYTLLGAHTDTWEVIEREQEGCATYGYNRSFLTQNGAEVVGLSCSNNAFDFGGSFKCHACEVGFVTDPNQPSGCTVLPAGDAPLPPFAPFPQPPSPSPPPSPPSPPPPPNCEQWCEENGQEWGNKCTWALACGGCPECVPPPSPPMPPPAPPPPPNCRETCSTNNNDWDKKCGWAAACGGCPECVPPMPPPMPQAPPPAPPAPPPPPNCRETCSTNNNDWGKKCGWRVACGGCPECYIPPSPPNPPMGAETDQPDQGGFSNVETNEGDGGGSSVSLGVILAIVGWLAATLALILIVMQRIRMAQTSRAMIEFGPGKVVSATDA